MKRIIEKRSNEAVVYLHPSAQHTVALEIDLKTLGILT
jgi:hypothetical protein